VQKSKNPLRILGSKLRRNSVEERRRELRYRSSQRRKAKVEAFENLEILPSIRRQCASSGGSTVAIRSLEKRDLDRWFLCPGRSKKSAQKRRLWTVGCSHRILSAVGSDGRCTGFKPSKPRKSPDTYRDIDTRDIRVLEVERSRLYKSQNSERITVVDLWEDACHTIIHFEDPGTGIRGGKSPETGVGIWGLQ
jgi:hypothetical protein